jgi:hypothetical protein
VASRHHLENDACESLEILQNNLIFIQTPLKLKFSALFVKIDQRYLFHQLAESRVFCEYDLIFIQNNDFAAAEVAMEGAILMQAERCI